MHIYKNLLRKRYLNISLCFSLSYTDNRKVNQISFNLHNNGLEFLDIEFNRIGSEPEPPLPFGK